MDSTTYALRETQWFENAIPAVGWLIVIFAITVIAYKMGRRGAWLWLPWGLLTLFSVLFSGMLTGFGSLPDFGPQLLLYLVTGAIGMAFKPAVGLSILILAIAGTKSAGAGAPERHT